MAFGEKKGSQARRKAGGGGQNVNKGGCKKGGLGHGHGGGQGGGKNRKG